MTDLFSPLPLRCGLTLKNRFVLAPLTNTQSHDDGVLSDEEFRWLTMRATGGFGLVMTCAAHVQAAGQGFPGQLGVWSDEHLPGLTRLAAAIRAEGAISAVQLHHAGIRAPKDLTGVDAAGPSADPDKGVRAMTEAEIETLIADFIAAAVRSKKAGFDGVEIHGAHGYILSSFLSPQYNTRDDAWGGSLENRSRIIFEIIDGIHAACGPKFMLGLRLSAERFGVKLDEARDVAAQAMATEKLDILDMSLWDYRKTPEEPEFKDKRLLDWFTDLPRHGTALGPAGFIRTGAEVRDVMDAGCDFVVIGRAAVLRHDFPEAIKANPDFPGTPTPVSPAYLESEGLSPPFVQYMRRWEGFVGD